MAVDILVRAASGRDLDQTCGQLPGVIAQVVGGPDGPFAQVEGCFVVRVLAGNKDFLKHAIDTQGYGTVVRELSEVI